MFHFTPQTSALVKSTGKTTIHGQFSDSNDQATEYTIGMLLPVFLEWARYERRLSQLTVKRYAHNLSWIIRDIGDLPVNRIHRGHILTLRRKIEERGCREARIGSILAALRSFLRFSRDIVHLPALDPSDVPIPRLPKRKVEFLSKEEVDVALNAILPSDADWRHVMVSRLRTRVVAEVLLGTGARISEVLSLNRSGIDFEKKEARIVGKGNKERVLFFTDRSLEWVKRYLSQRWDDEDALFVTNGGTPKRLDYNMAATAFKRSFSKAKFVKRATPRIFRHTMATTLLFNGCPIGHIKEMLGHDRLETTCKYYLGVDNRAAKAAHDQFLKYE